MFILIPIPPLGTRHVAAVKGAVWKLVSCAGCQERYAYLLELEAIGEDYDVLFMDGESSASRARAQAEQNFLRKSRNIVLPVPCPHCGHYQEDMARRLTENASINSQQIAGLVIGLLALIPLALGIPYLWILSVILAVIGSAVLGWGYVRAFGFDPNAGNPEQRKEIGRAHAVWGKPLEQLLATLPGPQAEPSRNNGK